MPDFNVRSDAVNVEQIMEQIRARISEKRGVDYTEAQIRELATVKLEKFLDPRGVRSDLLEQFRRAQPAYAPPELPNYAFEADTLFTSTRGPLRFIRKLLLPILKLFFNPNPLIQALNIQSRLNASVAEREAKRDAARYAFDQLHYEVMHNLVLETTRLGIEVKNLKMRLESLSSRLEFNERRARALESVVAYKPATEERPAKQDEGRREENRREETRREDGRRESRRHEGQGRPPAPAPPAPTPAPSPVAPQTQPDSGEPAVGAVDGESSAAAQPGAVAEGPGQKSRRRRRRRGRRGGGSAAALMGGAQSTADESQGDEGGDEGGPDAEQDDSSSDRHSETRAVNRPEPPEPSAHAGDAPAPATETGVSQAHTAPPASLSTSQADQPESRAAATSPEPPASSEP